MNHNFESSSNRRQTKMNWAADNNNEEEREQIADLNPEVEDNFGDRFELLSAYLDGEVSPSERQQVQSWLDNDPQTQHLYRRLLELRRNWQQIANPAPAMSADVLADKIFAKVDRRRNKRKIVFWASGAIAALCTGIFFAADPANRSPLPQLANQLEFEGSEDILASVAVDEPAVRIPKAANVYLPKEVKFHVDSGN